MSEIPNQTCVNFVIFPRMSKKSRNCKKAVESTDAIALRSDLAIAANKVLETLLIEYSLTAHK